MAGPQRLKLDKMPTSWNRNTLTEEEAREISARGAQAFEQARDPYSGYEAPSLAGRVWDIISGSAKGTASDFAGAGRTLLDIIRAVDTANSSYTKWSAQEAENANHYREMLARGTMDDGTPITASMRQQLERLADRADQRSEQYSGAAVRQHAPISELIDSVNKASENLAEQSARDIQEAKKGLGDVGQFAVDLGVAGTQLAGDALIGAMLAPVTGGASAIAPMVVRGIGSGAQQAQREGASLGQQVAYGLGSGALSAATEKISNVAAPLRKVFGKGLLDDAIQKAAGRLGQSAAGRTVLSAISEGGEEVVESLLQPIVQRVTYDEDALEQYDADYLVDTIYQGLIGGALGGALGAAGNIRLRRGGDASTGAPDAAGATQTDTAGTGTPGAGTGTGASTGQRNTPASTPDGTSALSGDLDTVADTGDGAGTTPGTAGTVTDGRASQGVPASDSTVAPGAENVNPADTLVQILTGGRRVDQSALTNEQFAALAERGDVGMDAGGRVYQVDPEQHIDRRGAEAISDRRVNAFQYDHPELQTYYRQAAETLLQELNGAVRGGQTESATGEYGQTYSWRTRRNATDRISGLLDGGMSYARIEAALDAIIHDKGRENNADAKRVEAVIDDMLSNGYRGESGFVPANQAYLDAKNAIAGAQPEQQTGVLDGVDEFLPDGLGAASAGFTGDAERGFSRNVATDQSMEQELRESFQEDPDMYHTLRNRETLRKAQDIFSRGVENARSTLEQAIGQAQAGRKLPPEMVPLSRMVANELTRRGDAYGARKLLSDIAVELTEAGQLGQAAAILRNSDPATKVQTISGIVKKLNERFGRKGVEIQADERLLSRFANAETEAERNAALDELYQNLADQIPSSFMDKFNALRYLNMLGNLKTQVRNVFGNAVMGGVRYGKGKVQALAEAAVSAATGGKYQRTTTFLRDRGLYRVAKADFERIKSEAMGERRYSDYLSAAPSEIQDRRTIFKNSGTWGTTDNSGPIARAARRATDLFWKSLEGYRRLTNAAMEQGDVAFSRMAYADSLARYLKARGVTAEQFSNGALDQNLLDEARAHAVREAQEATFRDNNAFSDMISSIGFKDTKDNIWKRAANVAVQGILPFRRTPANVAVRAVEYSPAGILTTAVQAARMAKGNSNITGADIINSLSKNMTGTGIFALGMGLFSQGLLTAGPDDDEAQANFDELTGRQDYALLLPDSLTEALDLPQGLNLTLDWMSPAAMPLFMGAEFMQAAEEDGITLSDALTAAASMSNVMLNMSMLQGVNDQLENISYADAPLPELVLNALTDFLTQGLTSTLAGQLERSFEDQRMMTYAEEGGQIPKDLQYELGSASSRIPGIDYQQIPYIDAWGRTENTGDFFVNLLNNTLNPSYVSVQDADAVERELQRIRDTTGDSGVFPSQAQRYVEYNNQKKNLTAEEYQRYAQTLGQTRYRALSSAMNSPYYESLTDAEKAEVIEDIYKYANGVAKQSVAPGYEPDKWIQNAKQAASDGIEPGTFIYYRNRLQALEDSGLNGSEANSALRRELLNDERLTATEKSELDSWIINDLTIIPKDVAVDYTNEETFTITQMSDGAQKRWNNIKNRFGIDAETYQATWKIYQNDDLKADQKRAQMAEYVGGNAAALYKAFGQKMD